MKIAVTGGRAYDDAQRVAAVLGDLAIGELMHGGADGADALAGKWAADVGIPITVFPADWSDIDTPPVRIKVRRDGTPYNALAGFRRNIEMLERGRPDLVVVFPGGRGTSHCHAQALKRGIMCLEVER